MYASLCITCSIQLACERAVLTPASPLAGATGERSLPVPPFESTPDRHRQGKTLADVRRILDSFDGFAGKIKLPEEAWAGREHFSLDRGRTARPRNAAWGGGGGGGRPTRDAGSGYQGGGNRGPHRG